MRLIAIAACFVSLCLAGCGDGSSRTSAPSSTPAPVVTMAPAPKPKPAARKLKKGETAPVLPAQPAAPELPMGLITIDTTPEQIGAHALVVAREQVEAGDAGSVSVADRHAFIYQAWLPAYEARVSELQAILAERQRINALAVADATRHADIEAKIRAIEAEHAVEAAKVERTVPVLDR